MKIADVAEAARTYARRVGMAVPLIPLAEGAGYKAGYKASAERFAKRGEKFSLSGACERVCKAPP